nr:hypothetical protein GCM10020093_100070 [Planobispora longispora]
MLGLRSGYDPDQVDALVRRIEGTLGRGEPVDEPITADEIREARFRAKLGGYNETAVDFALEAFIVAIETRPERGRVPQPRAARVPAPVPRIDETRVREARIDEARAAEVRAAEARVQEARAAEARGRRDHAMTRRWTRPPRTRSRWWGSARPTSWWRGPRRRRPR